MGNALRFLHKHCYQPTTTESQSLEPQSASTQNVGVSALAHDILQFEVTSQVKNFFSNSLNFTYFEFSLYQAKSENWGLQKLVKKSQLS